MAQEWMYADAAIRYLCAVLGVGVDRARMELAHRASTGKIRTKGLRSLAEKEEWVPLSPDVWKEAADWLGYGDGLPGFVWVMFNGDDVRACFPHPTDVPSVGASTAPRRAGRKSKYDWDRIFGEALRRVYYDGVPDNDSAFAAELLEWCSEQFDTQPADSLIREKIRIWLEPLRAKPPQ